MDEQFDWKAFHTFERSKKIINFIYGVYALCAERWESKFYLLRLCALFVAAQT